MSAKRRKPKAVGIAAGILTVQINTTEIHPLLAQVAMLDDAINYLTESRDADPGDLAEKSAERAALFDSIKAHGVQEPLYAVHKAGAWLVCDGRHRRAYALEAGRESLPVIEIPEKDARAVILRQNGQRRRQTKGQIAWLAVCVSPEVADATQGAGRSDKSELTRTALAAQAGVSADSIDQACKLFKLVGKSKKGRAAVEAQVAAGCGLGGIIAGLSGEAALPTDEDGAKRKPAPSITGLTKTFGTLKTQLAAFITWKEEQQEIALDSAAALLRDNVPILEFWREALAKATQP